ncbi:class I tRNA ligase family protein [Staphylococcus aureus]
MNGNDEEQKQVTRSYLSSYTLDNIMRMLHPFMPFVTRKYGKVST